MSAPRALLGGIVDYAGLFPPAALDMPTAVANYAAYRAGPDAWALGRFVVPASRLDELAAAAAPCVAGEPWRVSALLGADAAADVRRVGEFNERSSRLAAVDAVEFKASDVAAVSRVAPLVPRGAEAYAELPVEPDPTPLVTAVARAGLRAKVRTGGVIADAFPTSAQLARFIAACVAAGVPFKATAGLHHPLRATYRLTYDADSATATMFGFLNVFLAAALLRAGGTVRDAEALLEESDPSALRVGDDAITWREHRFDTAALAAARRRAVSFGSCSFREPMDEIRLLSAGW